MIGLPRIRIEPAQVSLAEFRAALEGSVKVTPDQRSMSQRSLMLISCVGENSQLDVRIVRIPTLETNGSNDGRAGASNAPEEITQFETWYWFSRAPDAGSHSRSTVGEGPSLGWIV